MCQTGVGYQKYRAMKPRGIRGLNESGKAGLSLSAGVVKSISRGDDSLPAVID